LGLESIIGVDERTRILETGLHPWRMICSLELHGQQGQRAVGTGWLAGPNTIVTAGHCVFHSMLGGWASTIVARPGRNETETPFGEVESRRFTSVRRWVDQADPDFDFAAIHLEDPIGNSTGYFSVLDASDAELQGAQINVSGYPADLGLGRRQWFHSKNVLRVEPRRLFYDVDTFGGQSGAPAWIYSDDSEQSPPQVVAVHAYGVGGTPASFHIEANSAPRLSGAVFDLVQEWLEGDN
jgi:V8-like Glu-specific endopeptidase